MPREHVYDPTPRGVDLATGEPGPERNRRVGVGWAKDMDVQVGVGWSERTLTEKERAAFLAGTLDLGADWGEIDERGRIWQSQWCNLDRHAINQLIRHLRHARDQAFGRDE